MNNRILIVTEFFYPEEFKINEIAFELKKKGYLVDVLTQVPTYPKSEVYEGYKNKLYEKYVYKDVTINRVRAVTGYKNSVIKKILKYVAFMIFGSVFSIINGRKYDYVLGYGQAALTAMVPAILIRKIYNKKVTLYIQDIWPDSIYAYGFKKTKIRKFFLEGFVKFVYRNASNFAISAPGYHAKIQQFCKTEKEIKFLPNWPENLDLDSKAFVFSEEEKFHFTFAGNVGTVQNLENVITAFGALQEKYLSIAQLNIIGDGSHLNYLESFVSRNNFQNIIFWGRKKREEMSEYYNGSDVLIISLVDQPIFSITIPSKFQTYIAAKKPIFAVIKGDVAEIVKTNNLGLSASPSDIMAIKKGFERFIDMKDSKMREFVQNGELLIENTFKKDKIINELEELLIKEAQ